MESYNSAKYSAALYSIIFLLSGYTYGKEETKSIEETVCQQQKDFVIGLLSHCDKRLPVISNFKNNHDITQALGELKNFLEQHPDALECVIDTFTTCLEAKCAHAPMHVQNCINSYSLQKDGFSSETTLNPQQVQQKLSALIVCYFEFQLTTLGAIDDYVQEFLQSTNLKTYAKLAQPFANTLAAYYLLNQGIAFVDKYLPQSENKATKKYEEGFIAAFTAGLLFTDSIKGSIEKAFSYTQENAGRTYAQLLNIKRKTSYRAKPSPENFNTLNGLDAIKLQFTPLVDFCAHHKEYRAADLKIHHGYLLEGDLSTGRKIAQALAGQAGWLICEIHASSLVDHKHLEKMINECLEFGPTVLLINNLDWIYKQADVEPDIYATIINKTAKYLSNDSNFPLVICATSQDHNVVDPVMLESTKLKLVSF